MDIFNFDQAVACCEQEKNETESFFTYRLEMDNNLIKSVDIYKMHWLDEDGEYAPGCVVIGLSGGLLYSSDGVEDSYTLENVPDEVKKFSWFFVNQPVEWELVAEVALGNVLLGGW